MPNKSTTLPNLEKFLTQFETFKTSAFRLQKLQSYSVDGEQADFKSYFAGTPLPDRATNSWLKSISNYKTAGKQITNIHLVNEPLSPYLQYALDWWYPYWHQAGAEVRLLLSPFTTSDIITPAFDFWEFDSEQIYNMNYDPEGHFLGPIEIDDSEIKNMLRVARNFSLAHSISLQDFIAKQRSVR